jgi:hypothetical protein
MKIKKRQLLILALIGSFVVALSKCTGPDLRAIHEDQFADKATCIQCHKDISEMYSVSAHFHTSAPVTPGMLGKISDHKGFYFNDSLKVAVENRNGKPVQAAYNGIKPVVSEPFDIAFGSGEKARTFGYWADGGLYQLPLTYYTRIARWTNSPGFPTDHPDFKRAIIGRCLECHSSFTKTKTIKSGSLAVTEVVEKGSIIYGIDCQRCHGPAAKHVAFHEVNPGEKAAKYMVDIKQLSRQQKTRLPGDPRLLLNLAIPFQISIIRSAVVPLSLMCMAIRLRCWRKAHVLLTVLWIVPPVIIPTKLRKTILCSTRSAV